MTDETIVITGGHIKNADEKAIDVIEKALNNNGYTDWNIHWQIE